MGNSKHTPGPWYWNAGRHTGPAPRREPRTLCSRTAKSPVDGTDGHVLIPAAKVMSRVHAAAIENIELEIHALDADELLIAAAPDLLAACERVAKMIANEPGLHQERDVLRAAITKATP